LADALPGIQAKAIIEELHATVLTGVAEAPAIAAVVDVTEMDLPPVFQSRQAPARAGGL